MVPARSAWNAWKLGFSSSSAAQHAEKGEGSDGGAAAAAAAAAAETEEQPPIKEDINAEELAAALAECQDTLEAETKRVRTF